MERQVAVKDKRTGQTKIVYKSAGPSRAREGHDRPMAFGYQRYGIGGGKAQIRLASAA